MSDASSTLTSTSRESAAARPVALPPAAAWRRPVDLARVLLAFGVVLRLAQYLSNRSLWLDEVLLASTVVQRSFLDLLDPLRFSQVAPLGFILIEKLATDAFGNAEYALRLFPLLSGIASLFLFYAVAKRCLDGAAVPLALALFAISDSLIYYSSEVRQYSSDVAIALLLLWTALGLLSSPPTAGRLAAVGLLGVITIWFSHPAVFILAGVATSSLVRLARPVLPGGGRARDARPLIVFALWGVSFFVCYLILLRDASSNPHLVRFWEERRHAFLPTSPAAAVWLPAVLVEFFWDPVNVYLPGIFFFVAGSAAMFREKRERLVLLVSPLLFTLAASALRKYPFDGRLLLFLVPSMILVTAEGAERVRQAVARRSRAAGAALVLTLFAYPTANALHDLARPRKHEEIRPVLSYVREHRLPGDVLYLYYGARPAFDYYREVYGLGGGRVMVGRKSRDARGAYIEDLSRLRGRDRVWVLFSHVYTRGALDERKFFLRYLDAVGKQLDVFKRRGASVYLYDLESEDVGQGRAGAAAGGSRYPPEGISWGGAGDRAAPKGWTPARAAQGGLESGS